MNIVLFYSFFFIGSLSFSVYNILDIIYRVMNVFFLKYYNLVGLFFGKLKIYDKFFLEMFFLNNKVKFKG